MIRLTFLFLSAVLVCEACQVGFWGWGCTQQCGFCAGTGSCGKYTGYCFQGCLPKYHGLECNETCSANCGGSGNCNRYTSFCSDGCKAGYSGFSCGDTCAPNCGGDGSCDITTGFCLQGCKPGYSGYYCS